MKRALLIILTLSLIPFAISQTPEHQNTDFFSNEDISPGEEITFGVQYGQGDRIDYATASLYNGATEVSYTPLVDRDGDNFYTGTLGGTQVLEDYRLVIKACNSDGCSRKVHYKEVEPVDWEDHFGTHRSSVLPR
ncbi:hypothetical protein [Candidatus Nanohalococcus occultus]|uniref:hypothetical protein n=1 Tax=Candidatus Nanohalococcus occultus TaxID=2978047 RepID=UPI0039E0DC8A